MVWPGFFAKLKKKVNVQSWNLCRWLICSLSLLLLRGVEFKMMWKNETNTTRKIKIYKTNKTVAKFFAKTMQGAKKASLRTSQTKLIGEGGYVGSPVMKFIFMIMFEEGWVKHQTHWLVGKWRGTILKMPDLTQLPLHPRPLMLGILRPPVISGFLNPLLSWEACQIRKG